MQSLPASFILRRCALSVTLAATLASGAALAQSAVGSIFGTAPAGATVQIHNADTGLSRTAVANSAGRYTFGQLPPGSYRVNADGQSKDVTVPIGGGVNASFAPAAAADAAATLDAVRVNAVGANPIDVSSVETSTRFGFQELQKIPVARNLTAVAMLAPGTVQGDGRFGNLPSIGGASVAENGYYINGFDVTNMRTMLSSFDIPYEAIGELQIKTGGYGAEYGRSLGGVINTTTKRGGNDWKFGGSVYSTPAGLRETKPNVPQQGPWELLGDKRVGRPPSKWYLYKSENDRNEGMKYNAYASGPIVRDRLFFFALAQGRNDTDTFYGQQNTWRYRDSTPQYVAKLDWNISDEHLLEYTAVYAPFDAERQVWKGIDGPDVGTLPDEYYTEGRDMRYQYAYKYKGGGRLNLLKYTGYLSQNFTLSAQAGELEYITPYSLFQVDNSDCPRVEDRRIASSAVLPLGCWDNDYATFQDKTTGLPETDKRRGYRLDAEWRLGDHLLRFGGDYEHITSNDAYSRFSGDAYYAFFRSGNDLDGDGLTEINFVDGFPRGTEFVRKQTFDTPPGSFVSKNTALYLEDTWQATPNLLLYGGLRRETFANRNNAGEVFIEAKDQWAPRLGFSWDVNGDSTVKIYGNAGRYFIPVPNDMNIAMSSYSDTVSDYYLLQGGTVQTDPVTGAPTNLGERVGPADHSYDGRKPPDARTLVQSDLKPMSQDEYILGIQWQGAGGFTYGIRGTRRVVNSGFDDYCNLRPFAEWAQDNGHEDFTYNVARQVQAGCMIINPGSDVKMALHLDGDPDGPLTYATIPNSYLRLPHYKRSYNALQFTAEKRAERWAIEGSYTLSRLYGNTDGFVNSTNGQAVPARTEDFDHDYMTQGAYGYLPNDRRHTLKLFGHYDLNEQWRIGGNLVVQSGRPKSCIGRPPVQVQDFQHGDIPPGITEEMVRDLQGFNTSYWCHSAPYEANWIKYIDVDGDGVAGEAGVVGERETHSYTSYAPVRGHRGDNGRTPWTAQFDLNVTYRPRWADHKLALAMDVYNLFNSHKPTRYNEFHDDLLDRGFDQPDLPEGDAHVYGPSANYNNIQDFQTARYVQLSARYDW